MGGDPRRPCLSMIPARAGMLILARRPFPAAQPFAETRPIVLCADPCEAGGGAATPPMLASPECTLRGHGTGDRTAHATGAVVAPVDLPREADARPDDPRVARVHVRWARDTCRQFRVERA